MLRFTQAKVIGGGSTINAQIYTRGNALDYDEWRQMRCDGLVLRGRAAVLPQGRGQRRFADERYHGKGGPLGVSKPRSAAADLRGLLRRPRKLGIPRNDDMTGEMQDGVGYYQLTQRDARRSSAAMAYLAPIRSRPNLTVRSRAQVKRIVVEAAGPRVWKMMDGEPDHCGEREVILSSGAIGSPRILMLSGIGPADHLRRSASGRSST